MKIIRVNNLTIQNKHNANGKSHNNMTRPSKNVNYTKSVAFGAEIHDAIRYEKNAKALEILRNEPECINTKDTTWQGTPLDFAVNAKNWDIFCELLKFKDIDLNAQNCYGQTALITACVIKDLRFLEELLKRYDTDVNIQDKEGNTALNKACLNGNTEAVKLLLTRRDVDLNIKNEDGYTPLISAAREDASEIVNLLLKENDLDINAKDNHGNTVLMHLWVRAGEDTIENIINHPNIDLNIRNNYGETPLINLCASGFFTYAKILLSKPGVKVNVQDNWGKSALIQACEGHCYSGSEKVIEKLLENPGINLLLEDQEGKKALDYAKGRARGCELPEELVRKIEIMTEEQIKNPIIQGAQQIGVNIEQLSASDNIWSEKDISQRFINFIIQKQYSEAEKMLERTPLIDLTQGSGVVKAVGKSENESLMEKLFDYKFHKQAQMKEDYEKEREKVIENLKTLSYSELRRNKIALNTEDGFDVLVNHPEFNPNDEIGETNLFEIACRFGSKYPYVKNILSKFPYVDTSNIIKKYDSNISEMIAQYNNEGKYKLRLNIIESNACDENKHSLAAKQLRQYLVHSDFNPKVTDAFGNSVLHIAASLPDDTAQMLIQKALDKGIDINAQNRNGQRPLMSAVKAMIKTKDKNGRRNIMANIKFLLDKGADINAQDNNGQTALHFACLSTVAALLTFLLNKNPNVFLLDKKGNRAAKYLRTPEMKEIYEKYLRG